MIRNQPNNLLTPKRSDKITDALLKRNEKSSAEGERPPDALLRETEREADWWEELPPMEPTEVCLAPLQFYPAGPLPFAPLEESDWESLDE